jgi:hypothetical protein
MENTIAGLMNDNINMDRTIAGLMNDNINMDRAIAGSMKDNINMDSTCFMLSIIDPSIVLSMFYVVNH